MVARRVSGWLLFLIARGKLSRMINDLSSFVTAEFELLTYNEPHVTFMTGDRCSPREPEMTDSDRVRESESVVAGDVAKALKLVDRLPLVCGALGTLKFQEAYGITLQSRLGPSNSTTTSFTYRL